MSLSQSDLSNSHYGYDFVVATTQASINATMKEFLYNTKFQTVKMYWNQDDQGNPVAVSYADLMKQTNNTDPLDVPAWSSGDPMTPAITNINNSNFYFAFEAAIGIPPDLTPPNIPDIVILEPTSQSVNFTLLCAQFKIVTCNFGRHGLTSFENFSQPSDQPWMFTSTVPLKNIIDNTNLPPAVQKQLKNLGPNAFSVQQLFLDLDNAALQSTPQIEGLDPGTPAYTLLSQVFIGAYFNEMKKTAQPVLNYSLVKNVPDTKPSTLDLTDLEMEVSPFKDPTDPNKKVPDLNTLNYLCQTDGGKLPPPVPFSWNWVDEADEATTNGAIAINRNTFANYFKNQMTAYIQSNCFKAYVKVWQSGFLDAKTNFKWSLTGGQTPTISMPTSGSQVLTYAYSSSDTDQSGLNGDMGKMKLSTSLTASVTFSGNKIIVQQTLLIPIYIRIMQSSESWNSVNKTITDTYTLSIGPSGSITAVKDSKTDDNSQAAPKANWFINLFTGLDSLVKDVDKWTKNFFSTSFSDIPLNVAQQFVFPGGKTFAFKDVAFSDHQDLVSNITYVQPFEMN